MTKRIFVVNFAKGQGGRRFAIDGELPAIEDELQEN
jgi:hypothetical protein